MNKEKFQLAAIFTNHCVLQRGKNIAIFGLAPDGAEIFAEIFGVKLPVHRKTYADAVSEKNPCDDTVAGAVQRVKGQCMAQNGQFRLLLPPLEAGLDHTLEVTMYVDKNAAGQTIRLTDIAIGEVWLAGGQSNMEFELCNCTEKDVLNLPANEMIRFYYTPKNAVMDNAFFKAERESSWEKFGDKGTAHWSAVGYFFAARLQEKLGVPVGIVGCNWGGTSASAWMDPSDLEKDEDLKIYMDLYLKETTGKSREQQKKEYDEYLIYQAEFDRKAAALYEEDPDIEWAKVLEIVGENRYPGPMGYTNPYRPGGLYECMLKRIAPYSLQGFLYYQGESDDHLPNLYYHLFRKMIERWRTLWQEDTLPFVFAQLPMHRYKQDPDFGNWPIIREAQQRVFDTVKHTAMVNIIDQGTYNDIHPKHKRVVGERMCDEALVLSYGEKDQEYAGWPYLQQSICRDGKIYLYIGNAREGLQIKMQKIPYRQHYEESKPPVDSRGFEIAGAEGTYYPAQVEYTRNCIVLQAKEVEKPFFARYLWTNYGDVWFYNKKDLPLAPFRTSRQDGYIPMDQSAEIQQKMVTGQP